jgi:hypothetical protein
MNKYISECGAGEITAQQYVMEQFLIILARQEHSTLPDFFWKIDKYKKLWKRHVRAINARIKEYGEVPMIRALQDKNLSRLRSFDYKAAFMWKPILEKYKKEYDLECKEKSNQPHMGEIINPHIRYNFNNNNELGKLKELDNIG